MADHDRSPHAVGGAGQPTRRELRERIRGLLNRLAELHAENESLRQRLAQFERTEEAATA